MQSSTIKTSLTKAQFTTPLYSPRTTYANHQRQITSLKTNMIINIDKYILGNLKNEFQKRGREITMLEFIHFSKKFLKDWNAGLYGREVKMEQCLIEVWREIDVDNKGKITWEQFNSKIIQTSLNLKTLSNNAGVQAPVFKEFIVPVHPGKYENPIAKLIYIKGKNKMAFFRQQSIQVQFFSTEALTIAVNTPQTKPIMLPQQQLKVQTIMKIKQKNQSAVIGQKGSKSHQKVVKKDIKVSSYKNTVIDSIYLDDQKYDMLIVSCSDKYIRGYNVSNIVPVIAVQPQNEDQQMIHQFPVEIYTMTWDTVNEVLYATGKHPRIYQWMIKTDSQREMYDPKGHDQMISSLLMMPKLQLLATGGYDGKLILWDTVGQVIKCRYEEHTRAISSITFHQGLILLFTSAFDHKICIWNPYINSMIHKIDNSLNVISLQVIPNTNFLLSLDCGGTVKIREINRFTQIGTFSLFRSQSTEDTQLISKHQKSDGQDNICMCSKKDGTIHYYFGTQKVIGFEYCEVQKNSINGGIITEMKYDHLSFKLYTPLKNHLVVWNLMTGRVKDVFYDLVQNDITTIEICSQLGFLICGDIDGNVTQRKIGNGFFVKTLVKMKTAINALKFHEVQRNEKEKSFKKSYLLFCTTQEGQVNVFKCHPKTQLTLYKQLSLRNDFSITHGNLLSIDYFGLKSVLIIKLSTNDVLFIDVEKKSLLIKIQLGEISIASMNILSNKDTYYLNILNKAGQITGFYLPSHPRKFKASCYLQIQGIQKPQCSTYSRKSHLYFISTENNDLYCVKLHKKYLQVDGYTSYLNSIWKTKIQNKITSIILIQNESILLLLSPGEDFTFVDVESGQILCKLWHQIKTQTQFNSESEPILYFNEKTKEIYVPNEEKVIKIDEEELQSTRLERIIDANFFVDFLKQKNIKNFVKVSSPQWPLNLNFNKFSQIKIQQIQQIQDKISKLQKTFDKKGPTQVEKKIQIAIQLQKKWQKQKQQQNENQKHRNQHSMSKLQVKYDENQNGKGLDKKNSRGNSLSMLWKHRQSIKKTQGSVHHNRMQHKQVSASYFKENESMVKTKTKFSELEKISKLDLVKLKNDPLYRLGQALKSVNNRDKKADNFIQMARKKEELKLPKINSQKIKL